MHCAEIKVCNEICVTYAFIFEDLFKNIMRKNRLQSHVCYAKIGHSHTTIISFIDRYIFYQSDFWHEERIFLEKNELWA